MAEDADVLLQQVKFEVTVTFVAIDLTSLDNVSCLAVNVDIRLRLLAFARLDELWSDTQLKQVSLLLL